MTHFDPKTLSDLYYPKTNSNGEENGQLTIIGGSSLFHGAPLLSLKVASRIDDMVFFSSPEPSLEKVADYIKSEVSTFIWVPFEEISLYIEKSDAVLIGPGFMRFRSESTPHNDLRHICDDACVLTRNVTQQLLKQFPHKKWVIDAGSLQTIEPEWIPEGAIITPNRKEFELLFKLSSPLAQEMEDNIDVVAKYALKYKCIIVLKGAQTIVASPERAVLIEGGNPGLTKGGTGDTQAGITVALLAKNEPFLAAASGAYLIKAAADELFEEQDVYFSADDVAMQIPHTLAKLLAKYRNLH